MEYRANIAHQTAKRTRGRTPPTRTPTHNTQHRPLRSDGGRPRPSSPPRRPLRPREAHVAMFEGRGDEEQMDVGRHVVSHFSGMSNTMREKVRGFAGRSYGEVMADRSH